VDSALKLTLPELTAILRGRYPNAFLRVLDQDYNVPTQAAVDNYMKELSSHLFDLYGDKWETYFDCDNFSLEAITLAYRKHFISRFRGNGNAEGIAFGLLTFTIKPFDFATNHCIAFWVDGDRNVREFEPQNRLPLPLNPLQCATASFAFVS